MFYDIPSTTPRAHEIRHITCLLTMEVDFTDFRLQSSGNGGSYNGMQGAPETEFELETKLSF